MCVFMNLRNLFDDEVFEKGVDLPMLYFALERKVAFFKSGYWHAFACGIAGNCTAKDIFASFCKNQHWTLLCINQVRVRKVNNNNVSFRELHPSARHMYCPMFF